MLNSIACRYEHFTTDWFAVWTKRIFPELTAPLLHRKLWEWCAVAQALSERGMLKPWRSGLGFAVGREPLASLFATLGVSVIATDLGEGESNPFAATDQHASALDDVFMPQIISREEFVERVRFEPADMRDLSPFADASVDFIWSSCAMEHLGTLEAGTEFILNTTRLLKPGGISVHTTEFNVGSTRSTIEASPETVIYRSSDLQEIAAALRHHRCYLEPLDLDPGTHPYDLDYDTPPWRTGGPHLKLMLNSQVCTSALLIVVKPAAGEERRVGA